MQPIRLDMLPVILKRKRLTAAVKVSQQVQQILLAGRPDGQLLDEKRGLLCGDLAVKVLRT